jgi:hypothetical protein
MLLLSKAILGDILVYNLSGRKFNDLSLHYLRDQFVERLIKLRRDAVT